MQQEAPRAAETSGDSLFRRLRWRSLHWFWLAPTLFVIPAGGLFCCAGLFYFEPIRLKFSEPYRIASERVRYDPGLNQILGEPIEEAVWLPDGQITDENDQTEAWFDFDVAGPDGSANVYAIVKKQGQVWILQRIEVTLPGGTRRELEL